MTAEVAAGGAAFTLAAQVAAALVEGCGRTRDDGSRLLGGLADAAHFRGPLRRAAASAAALPALPVDRGFPDRLREKPETRLCALLLGQPAAAVRAAGLRVAAAILHKSLIGVVLKADRGRLRDLLGEDAFAVAMGEAMLLEAPLVQLGEGQPPLDLDDPAAMQARLGSVGAAALVRFAGLTEPALVEAVSARLPESAGTDGGWTDRMTERHCGLVVRLLRRRCPGWATLIA